MTEAKTNSPNANERQPIQPFSEESTRLRNWQNFDSRSLVKLGYLPSRLYRAAAERLARGDTVRSVALWLMSKDLGPLNGVSERSLRTYLGALAYEIERQKRLHPEEQDRRLLVPEQPVPAPGPPSLARRPGARYRTLEDWMGEKLVRFNQDLVAMAAIEINYQYLDSLRRAEEVMVGPDEENPRPLHALAIPHASASKALMASIDQLNRNRDSRMNEKKSLADLDDDVSMPVMPKTPPTPEDLTFAREFVETTVARMKAEEKSEHEVQSACAADNTTVAG